jgi:hypothetical protein
MTCRRVNKCGLTRRSAHVGFGKDLSPGSHPLEEEIVVIIGDLAQLLSNHGTSIETWSKE